MEGQKKGREEGLEGEEGGLFRAKGKNAQVAGAGGRSLAFDAAYKTVVW